MVWLDPATVRVRWLDYQVPIGRLRHCNNDDDGDDDDDDDDDIYIMVKCVSAKVIFSEVSGA